MKFAVISDIHGNAPALQLVLEDAARHGADGFLFAGDYCISAPWACEAIDLMRVLPDARFVRGNDEDHLDVPPGDDGQFEVSRWCAAQLGPQRRAWLDALPETLYFSCENVDVHMAHSSQAFVGKTLQKHFRTSVLPDFYPDRRATREDLLRDFDDLRHDPDFRTQIDALSPGVYIFGHNHIQVWGSFDGRILVDPGSCGMPLDCGSFCAAYTLLSIENGSVSVEERRIPYDVDELIARVKSTGQYRAARVWSETIFLEWRTCREKVYHVLRHAEDYALRIGDPRRPFARDTWEAAFDLWLKTAPADHPELFVP